MAMSMAIAEKPRGILVDGDIAVHRVNHPEITSLRLIPSHLIYRIMASILITLMMSNPSGNEKRLP